MKAQKVTLTAVFLGALACTSVQTVQDPASFIATQPAQILVTYEDRSEVPVAAPRIRNDSIIGIWDGLGEPVALSLSKIARIDAIQKDSKKTALFIGGLALGTGLAVWGMSQASNDDGVICDYNRPDGGGNTQENAGPCYRSR